MIGEWFVKKLWFGYARVPWSKVERFYSRERAQAECDKRNNEKVTYGNQ